MGGCCSSRVGGSLVPVIDISALHGDDPAAKLYTAREIGRACEEIGFFVVTNHGVPQDIMDKAWSQTEDFFTRPTEFKKQYCPLDAAKDPYGYSAMGGEILSKGKAAEKMEVAANKPALGDLKEMYQMGPKNSAAGMAPRRLPTSPEGFAEAWDIYYEEINKLACRILSAFALALDLPDSFFDDKIDRHCSALRAINYPDQCGMVVPEGAIRASAHTDYGTVTVLRSGGPGLQVCKDMSTQGEQQWIDVPFIPNAFVINLGDLTRRWTNEKWVSTLHRVINPPEDKTQTWGRRQAMAFFHNLNKDCQVEAIPSCVSDANPQLYDPIVAGEFLMLKHLASQGQADPDAHLKRRAHV